MTENPIHRAASPELRGGLFAAVVSELDGIVLPMRGPIAGKIVDRLMPIIASVDANAHGRGRQEAVEVAASLMTQTDEIPPGGARCRCSFHAIFDEAETYPELPLDDEVPNGEAVASPEELTLLRVERALEAHFDAADGTIPAALVRSGIRSALNAATNEFVGW